MTREQLNDRRKKLGLSLEYMEKESNIALGTLKNFFYNKTGMPRIDTADAIAKMLGVTKEDILYSDVKALEETIEEMENPEAVSVIALKKLYEFQLEAKDAMHEKEKEAIHTYYKMYIEKMEEQYKKHEETLILDKKWFRLAAVFGIAGVLGIFFFIEFMTPSHGWLNLGDNHGILTSIAGGASVIELFAILWLLNKKKK